MVNLEIFCVFILGIFKKILYIKYYLSQDHIELLTGTSGEPLFFKQRDGQFIPVLRLLHKCKLGILNEKKSYNQ
jgi:hypothetical protein